MDLINYIINDDYDGFTKSLVNRDVTFGNNCLITYAMNMGKKRRINFLEKLIELGTNISSLSESIIYDSVSKSDIELFYFLLKNYEFRDNIAVKNFMGAVFNANNTEMIMQTIERYRHIMNYEKSELMEMICTKCRNSQTLIMYHDVMEIVFENDYKKCEELYDKSMKPGMDTLDYFVYLLQRGTPQLLGSCLDKFNDDYNRPFAYRYLLKEAKSEHLDIFYLIVRYYFGKFPATKMYTPNFTRINYDKLVGIYKKYSPMEFGPQYQDIIVNTVSSAIECKNEDGFDVDYEKIKRNDNELYTLKSMLYLDSCLMHRYDIEICLEEYNNKERNTIIYNGNSIKMGKQQYIAMFSDSIVQ